jgi:hypothetical protein
VVRSDRGSFARWEERLTNKRDYIGEIEEIRGRTGPSDWDNGITKLLFLTTAASKLEADKAELAYYCVAAIAAIEVYFRWEIKRLIDSGDPRYLNNLKVDELPLKITHDLLVAVHGKRITIGELVAHSVGLGNLEAISKVMGPLLGTDFLALVKDARDPELRRAQGESAPTAIASASTTLARVKRAFELRHITCHEAHLTCDVGLAEIKELCSSCYDFARASRFAIAYHENPQAPLTLQEACEETSRRVQALEQDVVAIEQTILDSLPPPMQNAFNEMEKAWRAYVKAQAGFDASHDMNANRGALYEQCSIAHSYTEWLEKLTKYAVETPVGTPPKAKS